MIQAAKTNAKGIATNIDLECGDQYTLLKDDNLVFAFYNIDIQS